MPDQSTRDAIKRWERLKSDRGTWESHWQQCANYLQPERASYITERVPGQRLMTYVYDATPLWALDQFANGLHGFLTSTDLRWFSLRYDDDRLNRDHAARRWADQAAEAVYRVLSGPQHTFAAQSHEYYQDLGCIGTAVMAELEGPGGDIRFSTRHLKECVIAENEAERVDTLLRRFKLTAAQAFQRWGAAAGEAVTKALEKDQDKQLEFLHVVQPRRQRDPQRADRRNKLFTSTYHSIDDQMVIDDGGFDEFPFHVSRFAKSTGEIYGRSPGMRALPDIKMLNEAMKLVIKATQKVVDPPLQVPDDGFMLPLKTTPGGLLFYRAGMRPSDRVQPLLTDGNIPIGNELLNALRQSINRSFYVDWFIMPSDLQDPASDGKGITATFTMTQREQKMRQASPMVARLQGEFCQPVIERTFAILWRQSKARRFGPGSPFLAPPESIRNVPIHVEYVSPLAVAQRSSELDTISRVVESAIGLAQIDPQVGGIVDAEAVLRRTADDLNAPTDILRSADAVAAMREQAVKAAQQQQEQQAVLAGARAAKDGSGALQNLSQLQAQGAAQGAAAAGYAPAGA